MTHQEFQDYLKQAAIDKGNHPELRMGQIYWNNAPNDLIHTWTGTGVDCFNDDNRIGAFLDSLFFYVK